MWKTTKFLLDKEGEKSRFRELSTDETTEKKKKTEHALPAAIKKPQKVWFEII